MAGFCKTPSLHGAVTATVKRTPGHRRCKNSACRAMEISSDDVSVGLRHELAVLALCLFRRAAENRFQPDCKARSRTVCWQSEEGA